MEEKPLVAYLDSYKAAGRHKTKAHGKPIRIALLGSFTLNGFKETLSVKCREAGIIALFYVGDYNQYVQGFANEGSSFYKFRPDITFLLVDTRSVFGDLYLNPYGVSALKRKEAAERVCSNMSGLIKKFLKHGSGMLVMNNFEVPVYSPIGITEPKERFGYIEMVRKLNSLVREFNRISAVFTFDYDSFASEIGKYNVVDDKMFYLADMRVAPNIIPHLCGEYMRYVKALASLARKCIVLDMDNTLWGGIVGEEGFEGIKLGPAAPGNAYMDFQKRLLALFNRGVILAINSNNNREDAMKVLQKHPYMVLRERHFASIKINWESKVTNLVEIAKDINITLDSIIFLEDDKRTRHVVREALPQVLCPDIPEDASDYSRFITGLKDIDVLQITPEDKRRGALYVSERERKESRSTFRDLSRYLKHLDVVVRIRSANRFNIPRISQLTLRTNQFNFSTKRYNEKTVERFILDKAYSVYCVDVKDKYGDYGITGALIIQQDKKKWRIDTYLLSCRVLGRNIEEAVIGAVIGKAVKEGVEEVNISYSKTGKNMPVFIFLKENGIDPSKCRKEKSAVALYRKNRILKFKERSKHIKVIFK